VHVKVVEFYILLFLRCIISSSENSRSLLHFPLQGGFFFSSLDPSDIRNKGEVSDMSYQVLLERYVLQLLRVQKVLIEASQRNNGMR
ncbi:hypothetical protein B296_00001472, partial [Ensete ventricosum]